MATDIKQAMHVEASKSFGCAEANENERHWNEDKIDSKNQDPTNHYDKTRLKLNFEIGPDGKIHPLGYQEKALEVRLQERLDELGWKQFKADSKIQPNCCAKIIFGGNHERTLEMAFGRQTVNLEKDADNSHLHRCPEVEDWAKDVYDWCAARFGQENVIGFQVHLDESSPHIHALIVPVGLKGKKQREAVMWSAKFGKNPYEYGAVLREMHTSLYEEVGSKYGLERGDSIAGRNVQHLSKRDYIRKLTKELKQTEKALKGLQTMMRNLEAEIETANRKLIDIESDLTLGRISLANYNEQKMAVLRQLNESQALLQDKNAKIKEKNQELERVTNEIDKLRSVQQPFRNHKIDFTAPQITEKPPMLGVDKWLKKQNSMLEKAFNQIVDEIAALYMRDAERQVKAAQDNVLADYAELHKLRKYSDKLMDENQSLSNTIDRILSMLVNPETCQQIFDIFDSLSGGHPLNAGSSGGGGGDYSSDLHWDGRKRGEYYDDYRKRCMVEAFKQTGEKRGRRR